MRLNIRICICKWKINSVKPFCSRFFDNTFPQEHIPTLQQMYQHEVEVSTSFRAVEAPWTKVKPKVHQGVVEVGTSFTSRYVILHFWPVAIFQSTNKQTNVPKSLMPFSLTLKPSITLCSCLIFWPWDKVDIPLQTWYLSQVPRVVSVGEKNLACGEISNFYTFVMWRNLKFFPNHHVETIKISPHNRCGEIWNISAFVMWRKLRFLHICHVEKSEISLHLPCGENSDFSTWQMGKSEMSCVWFLHTVCRIFTVLLQNLLFAIYAVFFPQNLFCRDLRAFAWRKNEPKLVPMEKNDKYQVWIITPI